MRSVFFKGMFFFEGGRLFVGRMFVGFLLGIVWDVFGVFWAFCGVGESFSAVLGGICPKTAPHFVWS